jgi:hypothetical protein
MIMIVFPAGASCFVREAQLVLRGRAVSIYVDSVAMVFQKRF